MNHMMIDLETLATSSASVVVSVGAAVFNEETILRTGYWVLDIDEQIQKGRRISASTLQWWMKQGDRARDVFKDEKPYSLQTFSLGFLDFFRGETLSLWGNGADFDLAIMIDLFDRHRLVKAEGWKYYNHMCYRTFNRQHKCKNLIPREGVHHNAVDDAVHQTKCVLASGKLKL